MPPDLEELGHRESIRAVLLHAERKRLDALQEHPGIVRRDAAAEVQPAQDGQLLQDLAEHDRALDLEPHT